MTVKCGNCGTTQGPFEKEHIGTRKSYVVARTCKDTKACMERRRKLDGADE